MGDLLRLSEPFDAELAAPEKAGPFDVVTSSAGDLEVRKYLDAAEAAGAIIESQGQSVVDCAAEDDVCAEAFIEVLGRRAFRRPLTEEHRELLWTWYEHGRDDGGVREGMAQVVRGVLQSPYFLYHVQPTISEPDAEGVMVLDDYAIAARLSFFLWESGPDDALLDAAERGELQTPDGRAAQAERLLGNARADAAIASFHHQWLGTDDRNPPPALVLATENAGLVWDAMRTEVTAFTAAAAQDADPDALFSADWSVMPVLLADYYGIDEAQRAQTDDPELVRVHYPDGRRGGLLTLGAVMASTAHSQQTSPIIRGVFVLEHMLCTSLAPPDDMEIEPLPDRTEDQTVREWLGEHRDNPACAACHEHIDPLGFAMEDYGADGRWRAHDGLFDVDAAGAVAQEPVDGAAELSRALGTQQQSYACRAQHWLHFANARQTPVEACGLEPVLDAARSGDVPSLVEAIVRSESFAQRRALPEEA